MVTHKINSKHKIKCLVPGCRFNENCFCKLYLILFDNGVCISESKNLEKSSVEIRLYDHKTDEVKYKRLTKSELMLIENILSGGTISV